MIYDIQRGSLLKRASAFLLDFILISIVAVGFAALFSAIFDYDGQNEKYAQKLEYYSNTYNVTFEITLDQYNAMTEAERANWDSAYNALVQDGEAIVAYNTMVWMIISITSVSIFLAFILLEFMVPLIFKNGQTVGKKIFALGVMRSNGVKVSAVSLFIRTFLGKYIIETMIPVLVITMVFFNTIGIIGPIIVAVLLLTNLALVLATRNKSMIHDFVADCVVVDLASQLIFESEEALIEYKKQLAAEAASNSEY